MKKYREFAPSYDDEDIHIKFTQFILQACDEFTRNGSHEGLWRDAKVRWEDNDDL